MMTPATLHIHMRAVLCMKTLTTVVRMRPMSSMKKKRPTPERLRLVKRPMSDMPPKVPAVMRKVEATLSLV